MSTKALPHPDDAPEAQPESRRIGRYVLYGPIARGGMATVHLARLVGADGFTRIVAAKRLHEQFAEDPEFVEMFRNEARIASCVHHPNVVPVLDLIVEGSEVILVQEYVRGVPLDKLLRAAATAKEPIPTSVVVAIVAGVLCGLHAAHEAKDERGEPLRIIHRDVTPHNIVVGEDGVPRLLDFGIAKARSSAQVTREGFMKGKLTYMAPEQFRSKKVTRKIDIYSAGVVIWELLTMRRLHAGQDDLEVLSTAMAGDVPHVLEVLADQYATMGERRWSEIEKLAPIVAKMMTGVTANRWATAEAAMAALVEAVAPAPATAVAEWVQATGHEYLERCQGLLRTNEESWRSSSKIAVATPPRLPPESGVRLAVREVSSGARETVPDASLLPTPGARLSTPVATTANVAAASAASEDPVPAKRGGRVGWALAGLLLVALVTLVGLLLVRPDAVLSALRSIHLPNVSTQASADDPLPLDVPTAITEPTPDPALASIAVSASVVTAPPTAPATKGQPITQPTPRVVWRAPPVQPTHTSPPPTHSIDVDPPY
jgi:serine/threonine-protein kinase